MNKNIYYENARGRERLQIRNELLITQSAQNLCEIVRLQAELAAALEAASILSGMTAARYEAWLLELRAALETTQAENGAQKARIVAQAGEIERLKQERGGGEVAQSSEVRNDSY